MNLIIKAENELDFPHMIYHDQQLTYVNLKDICGKERLALPDPDNVSIEFKGKTNSLGIYGKEFIRLIKGPMEWHTKKSCHEFANEMLKYSPKQEGYEWVELYDCVNIEELKPFTVVRLARGDIGADSALVVHSAFYLGNGLFLSKFGYSCEYNISDLQYLYNYSNTNRIIVVGLNLPDPLHYEPTPQFDIISHKMGIIKRIVDNNDVYKWFERILLQSNTKPISTKVFSELNKFYPGKKPMKFDILGKLFANISQPIINIIVRMSIEMLIGFEEVNNSFIIRFGANDKTGHFRMFNGELFMKWN